MSTPGPIPPAPFPRVLCAIDGSRHATEAVKQAATLCAAEARLTLLAVTDVRGFGVDRLGTFGPVQAEDALANAVRAAREAGVEARTVLRRGTQVQTAILETAGEHDLLVLVS